MVHELWLTNSHRPAEDTAFSVARFFEKGGGLQNYYMVVGVPVVLEQPNPVVLEQPISLKVGKNEIALISFKIGLPSGGPYYEWVGTGVFSVNISGLSNGTLELSGYPWKYKVGLEGEHLKLSDGLHSANWVTVESPPKNQPFTWYKILVKPPSGHHPVGLDMIHMGKGQVWLNGHEIGRYWNKTIPANGQCEETCDYRGTFDQIKCVTGCGETTQRWYHVPRSWFKPSGNVLVVFEEVGGDPTKITFSMRKISNVCTLMSEDHPPSVESWSLTNKENDNVKAPAGLSCPGDAHISAIKFASLGTLEDIAGPAVLVTAMILDLLPSWKSCALAKGNVS